MAYGDGVGSDVIRGSVDTMLLCLLLDGPSYGYELQKRVSARTNGQYELKETTLYSAFNRLEKGGYLESFSGEETQGRKRTYYRLTDKGRNLYRVKVVEWQLAKQVIEPFIKEEI